MALFQNNSDVFRTQADTRFNSFSDPLNAVNANPGPWGVDPNYLTPAYLSPFRPRYQGPSAPSYSEFRPSWSTSANQLFNPFAPGGDNYGGNFMQQNNPYYDRIFQTPADGLASFTQKWVMPAAVTWAAYRQLGIASTKIGKSIGGNLMGGIAVGGGMSAPIAAQYARAGRWAGGIAGGLVLPTIAAQLGVDAIDNTFFDPYISQRKMGHDLRENFRGITFGDEGVGEAFTGGGLSRAASQRIAQKVSVAAAKDMTFNQEEVQLLTDYASRSGLLDNVNASQMSDRFESIIKQVKMVMSVANTSDFRETIEIMSKMQMAGVSSPNLAGVMGNLRAAAAAGGFSVQKGMNTVGAQGQVMFGAAGLTPYAGQIAGFENLTSMNAAFRSGLISPAMMARMGGPEGAAQAALAGQLAAYRTPYSGIMSFNQYMGGGDQGSVAGNLARFGGAMSQNPVQSIGRYLLSENALASRFMQDKGLMGVQEKVKQIAQTIPGAIGSDGKVDAGTAFLIMTQNMGIPEAEARALIAQIHSFSDPATSKQMITGHNRAARESILEYQRQEGLNKGIFTRPILAARQFGKAFTAAGSEMVGDLLTGTGSISDDFQNWWLSAMHRVKPGDADFQEFEKDPEPVRRVRVDNIDALNREMVSKSSIGRVDGVPVFDAFSKGGGVLTKHLGTQELEKINIAASKRDPNALRLLSPNASKTTRMNALRELVKGGVVGQAYGEKGKSEELLGFIDRLGVETVAGARHSNEEGIRGDIEKFGFGKTGDENIQFIQAMTEISPLLKNFNNLSPDELKKFEELKAKIAQIRGKNPADMDNFELEDEVKKMGKALGESGLYHLGTLKGATTVDAAMKQLKDAKLPARMPKVQVGVDDEAARTQMKAQLGIAEQRSKTEKLRSAGLISTNEAMANITALDNKQAVLTFEKAVGDFANAVGQFKGDGKKPVEVLPSGMVKGEKVFMGIHRTRPMEPGERPR